jgi:hypothetical protein
MNEYIREAWTMLVQGLNLSCCLEGSVHIHDGLVNTEQLSKASALHFVDHVEILAQEIGGACLILPDTSAFSLCQKSSHNSPYPATGNSSGGLKLNNARILSGCKMKHSWMY